MVGYQADPLQDELAKVSAERDRLKLTLEHSDNYAAFLRLEAENAELLAGIERVRVLANELDDCMVDEDSDEQRIAWELQEVSTGLISAAVAKKATGNS